MKLSRPEIKKARIEIIPMIDTIFFLLVFFMLTSLSMVPMSAHRVNLPSSSTASAKPREKVVVTVSEQGRCYVDRMEVPAATLTDQLKNCLRVVPMASVVINCDKNVQVASFLFALDAAKQARPHSLLIAAEPKGEANSL